VKSHDFEYVNIVKLLVNKLFLWFMNKALGAYLNENMVLWKIVCIPGSVTGPDDKMNCPIRIRMTMTLKHRLS
jgi:hypothetical protein